MTSRTHFASETTDTSGTATAYSTFGTPAADLEGLAPGLLIEVRDEGWLVSSTTTFESSNGETAFRISARGVSDYVKDQNATFLSTLDRIRIIDPMDVEVVPDMSPNYRKSRIWVESTLRNTPVPMGRKELAVADRMLMDPLDYQKEAVTKTLGDLTVRPRILLADAVGLGKTLEIGMILAELVRRGRGERILIVTPLHVLEQFQQEMWTRFALPFVRLDSQGIQRVRQKLPASRNPFTYFPKVIVSIDTLKSAKYLAQLEQVEWDAVVIDEVHNATNTGTQNNQLARTLAPKTEALILASATPHNGNEESFKEIIRLLDPTAVNPDGSLNEDMVQRLILRRHRNSPEVAREVGADWAEREEPNNIAVTPSKEENAVLTELEATWTGKGVTPPTKSHLFPWTLMKAFLSSPAAFEETIDNRLKTIGYSASNSAAYTDNPEVKALLRLCALNSKIATQDSNKFAALISYLKQIGVGPRKSRRVVIFSERVATLHWLAENIKKHLKLPKAAVEIMHGGLDDVTQMRIIDDFKREDSPIRVLITGDVASEGVNLHAQCHHMVHYDIPWSLIGIQQRNGRIDRYGQKHRPQFATLLFDPANSDLPSDVQILTRLMEREYQAFKVLGDAGSLMGKFSQAKEEDVIRDIIRGQRDFDEEVADPQAQEPSNEDLISQLLGLAPSTATSSGSSSSSDANPPTSTPFDVSLYDHEIDFLQDALFEGFTDPSANVANGGVGFRVHDNQTADLTPPDDLKRRLDLLPQDYLRDRQVKESLALATTKHEGIEQLVAARSGSSTTTWPKAHFLGPLHPVTTWAQQRALSSMGRSEIPAMTSSHAQFPEVLFMGTVSNKLGQVVAQSFIKVTGFPGPDDALQPLPEVIASPVAYLRDHGLQRGAVNRGDTQVPASVVQLIRDAEESVRGALNPLTNEAAVKADNRIKRWHQRADQWKLNAEQLERTPKHLAHSRRAVFRQEELVDQLVPRELMVRPILVIVPEQH